MMGQKGCIMTQIHKKFSGEQVKILLTAYEAGHLSRSEIENTLEIGKTSFLALLKLVRDHPDSFSIQYQRKSKGRLSSNVEEQIRSELPREKGLVENKDLPISGYNYAALNDRLKRAGVKVSTTTLIKHASNRAVIFPKRRKKNSMIGRC